MKRIFAALTALLFVLAACVPGTTDADGPAGSRIVIVNGPRENSVPGLADTFDEEIRRLSACCNFEIQWSDPVRAQERQRDLYGHRAFISTGSIARSFRASWGVLVGSHQYTREVTEVGERLFIDVSSGVRVFVTDDQGNELARLDSRVLHASRTQPASRELVSEHQEPLLAELAERALHDVTAGTVEFLNTLAD